MKHTPGNDAAFARSYSEQQPGDRKEFCYAQEGMTMREWYAGMAMNGLLATGGASLARDNRNFQEPVAQAAFAYADAMLVEAPKKPA